MAVNPDKNIVEQSLIARLIGKIKRIALDMGDSVTAETSRAQAAEGLKADKVQGATAGNLAALDASGNLTDSGSKAADFKTKQTPVTDPSASGAGLEFIDSVSQNANGEITPHKKSVQDGTTAQKGVVKLSNAIDSTSVTEAATPKAVKDAYDELNNKIVARAVFLSQAEWAVQSQLQGDPAKVYYVENGTGEDAYTVYVWKESTSEYVEVDESSIDLDGYWHDGPTTTGDGNVVTNITLGNDGVPQVEKGMSAEPAFSVLPVSKGGTGKTTGKAATNNLFSDINTVNTDPDDTARIVFKYGSPSDSNGIFFARSITNLWNYIKGKISSVLGLSENGYTGNAATASAAASGSALETAINAKLGNTGDASNTTSTFTKASGDTSTMTSGGKLSAIFTAISSFFASLKALAFKNEASYNDLSSGVQSSLDKADSALQYKSTSQSSGSYPLLVNDSGTGKYNGDITLDIAKAAINGTVTKDVAKIVTISTTFAELVTLRDNGNIIFYYEGQPFYGRYIVLPIPLIRVDWTDTTRTTIKAFVFGFADYTDSSHYGRLYTKTCDKDTGWSSGLAGNDTTYSKLLLNQYNSGQTDFNDYGILNSVEYRATDAGFAHAPNATQFFNVITVVSGLTSYKTQIAFECTNDSTKKAQAYIRFKYNNSWSDWSTFVYSNGQSDLFTSGSSGYGTHSADDAKSNGVYYCGNSFGSGMPSCIGQSTSVDGALLSFNYNDSWGSQIAQDYRRGDLFVRGRCGVGENADNRGHAATVIGWTSWKQVVTMPVAGSTQQQVGSTSTPVYVDSNGQVQPCDPSQMGVGAASYAEKAKEGCKGSNTATLYIAGTFGDGNIPYYNVKDIKNGCVNYVHVKDIPSNTCSITIEAPSLALGEEYDYIVVFDTFTNSNLVGSIDVENCKKAGRFENNVFVVDSMFLTSGNPRYVPMIVVTGNVASSKWYERL